MPNPATLELFESLESQQGAEVYSYRLFEPAPKNAPKDYPLLLWLQDHGEVELHGPKKARHLNHLGQVIRRPVRDDFPFYVLAMQCPAESKRWNSRLLTAVGNILLETLEEYPIDVDRVYLAGLGTGGTACWELLVQHPDKFAAVAPIASQPTIPEIPDAGLKVPIWAFTPDPAGREDDEAVLKAVENCKEAGGVVHLTRVVSEDAPWIDSIFSEREYNLTAWLMAQRRGAFCWNRPGRRPWEFRMLVVQVGVPLLVAIAILRERRRRRRLAA